MTLAHGPCVCVSHNARKCSQQITQNQESQDGTVCMRTHTQQTTLNISKSGSVMSQSNVKNNNQITLCDVKVTSLFAEWFA